MKIETQKSGTELTLIIEGKVDATTAPTLEIVLESWLPGVTKLVLDFAAVTFLASAGIRSILSAMIQMKERQGTMILRNVADNIKEVFVMTGLHTVLNFE